MFKFFSSSSKSKSNTPPPPPAVKSGSGATATGSLSQQLSSQSSKVKKNYDESEPNYYYYYTRLEKRSQQDTGLVLKRGGVGQFKLTDFSIKSEINDASSTTVFTQRYHNGHSTPVEAKYQIPLAPYAAISGFVVTYDDKVLNGQVKEKEEAFAQFSDAIASGNQAFLGEKSDNGYFNLSIGNLPPTKEVTISITIISEIGTHLSDLHYCLHRYMFPTYDIDLKMDLSIQLSSPIESIEMGHYVHKTNIQSNKANLTMEYKGKINKNLIVIITPLADEKPNYFLEGSTTDSTMALALNFYPRFQISPDEVDQKSEYIFLLDCSGSMSGSPIQSSKLALEILMRSLTEKTKFNIYCFGSDFNSLFPTSQLYSDATLESASAYISGIDADLGGTELLPPVKDILSKEYDPQYPRQVFILTDGEISERDKLIDYVAKEANTTRIFTLGIGGGVDRELVIGLSKACKGFYEFIKESHEIDTQVMKLLNIAMEPTISNIQVNWNGLDITQAPQVIRPIFNNERMMIYGLLNSKPKDQDKVITITCDGPKGDQLVYKVDVDFSGAKTDSNSLHTLTAFQIIKDLEELERKQKQDHKNRIVELGKKYRLVSKHTSFVVVAESDKPVLETMKPVDVLDDKQFDTFYIGGVSSDDDYDDGDDDDKDYEQDEMYVSVSSSFRISSTRKSKISKRKHCFFEEEAMEGEEDEEEAEMGYLLQIQKDRPIERELNSNKNPKTEEEMCQYLERRAERFEEAESESDTEIESEILNNNNIKMPRKSIGGNFNSSPTSNFNTNGGIKYQFSRDVHEPSNNVNDPVVQLIKEQKANGSWSNITQFKVPTTPKELSGNVDVWTTLVVIAKLMKDYQSSQDKWTLVVSKATKWVKSQISKIGSVDFDTLLNQAKLSV